MSSTDTYDELHLLMDRIHRIDQFRDRVPTITLAGHSGDRVVVQRTAANVDRVRLR